MAYTLSINLALASTDTGLSLSAQLIDTAGANVGSAVTTGFVEIGVGNYLWTYADFPDGFRGGVKFSSGGTVKAFTAINPQDGEYLDAKVSGLPSALLDLASAVDGKTIREILRLVAAWHGGKVSGAPNNPVARDLNDTKDRVRAITDANGNRTSITLDLS